MDRLTTIFDCCLYLAGLALALVVALFVVVAGYELALTFIRKETFARRRREGELLLHPRKLWPKKKK